MAIPERNEPTDFAYTAFISYRHLPRDAQVAQRVQKAIETHRLPRGIAFDQKESSANSPVRQRRLGKCFRDEDELAASHSLPESIQQALAQSRSLIVICSPQSQESIWVQREIEMFAALHGRERIICVLADGDTTTSIPPLLKKRLLPDISGAMREMPAEPLAADLRPGSMRKHKAELLRIIAAVANCNYDDLRRREQSRKRRRTIFSLAAVALTISLVAAVAFQLHRTSEAALIAESKVLAAQALEQYEHGERLQAIETALKALPSSEADRSRPLVPEAQAALDKVLGLNPNPNQPWLPLYLIDVEGDIVNFTYNREGGWIAILDTTGTVSFYDSETGSPIANCLPEPFENAKQAIPKTDWFITSLSPSVLLAGNRTTAGGVSAYDPFSGRNIWTHSKIYALIAKPTENQEKFGLLTYSSTSITAAILKSETGGLVSGAKATVDQFPRFMNFDTFCANDDLSTAYYGLGNSIASFDLNSETCQEHPVSETTIQSIQLSDDTLVFASSNSTGDDINTNQIPFSLHALDTNALDNEPLWSIHDTYSIATSIKSGEITSYHGLPRINSIIHHEQDLAVVTAGKKLLVVSLRSGETVYRHEFEASIVDAAPCLQYNGDYAISVALSNGKLNIVSPLAEISSNNDSSSTEIPYVIDGALLGDDKYDSPIAFIHTPSQPNRIFCYGFWIYTGEDAIEEFSLDELLYYAHKMLGHA